MLALLAACAAGTATVPAPTPDNEPPPPADEPAQAETVSEPTPLRESAPVETRVLNGMFVRVDYVTDGDTMTVMLGGKYATIRLAGLSAPECHMQQISGHYECAVDKEFYGLAAREELVGVLGTGEAIVTCDGVRPQEPCPTDNWGRYVAYLDVGGVDVATQMAKNGAALSYTLYASTKRGEICAAEYEAQTNGRGMWATGTVDSTIDRMSERTQKWYAHHDSRCAAANAPPP